MVTEISPLSRGVERRRLLDLGIIPGTEIGVELVNPGGDPTAYRIRGTVIALRSSQARLIRVSPLENTEN
jgi:Fe2+ transport system protein FeoA